ncbi:hypothetical protein QE152_g29161 [Popillia japonica]|uniref:Uncharacterized protein n=1 Tax=Popillia japonica TaxID=7064 RepID=A0AAW1JIH8_POPJA
MAQYSDKHLLLLRETISKIYKNKTFTTREIHFLQWRFMEYPENYTENDNLNEVLECYNQYIDIILKYSEFNHFETYKMYRSDISKYMKVIGYVEFLPYHKLGIGLGIGIFNLNQWRNTVINIYFYSEKLFQEIHFLQWRFMEYPENYTENDNLNEVLECYNQYIDIILKYSEFNHFETYKMYRSDISKYMKVIGYVGDQSSLVNKFVDGITVPIFEHITDPSIKIICAVELIQVYNNIIRNCNKSVKEKLANSGARIYLYKLADVLCSCGDYEYQASLLETIFRICQGNLIKLFAADFFPGTESLQHAFVKFDIKNFDNATRTFLNIVNKVFQNVYSFVAGEILLDNENVIPPMDLQKKQTELWVDCNKSSRTIGIYCSQSCWRNDPCTYSQESEYVRWELIIISVDDVSSVEVKREKGKSKTQKSSTVFKFSLTNPFFCPSENTSNSKCLKIVINDADVVQELKTSIFPSMFKKKFQGFGSDRKSKNKDTSLLEVDVSYHKSSYKPLELHVANARSVRSVDTRSMKSLEDMLAVKHAAGITRKTVGVNYISPNSTRLDDSLIESVCISETQYFSADEYLHDNENLHKQRILKEQPIIYRSHPTNDDTEISKTKAKIKVKFPFTRKHNKQSFDPLFSPIYEGIECRQLEENDRIQESSLSEQFNTKCKEGTIYTGVEVIKSTPTESLNNSTRKSRKEKHRQTSEMTVVSNDVTNPPNDLEIDIRTGNQYSQESTSNLRSKKKPSQEKVDIPSNSDKFPIKCNDIFDQMNEVAKGSVDHKSQTISNMNQKDLGGHGRDIVINGENENIDEVMALADTCGYSTAFWNELDNVVKEAELQHIKNLKENTFAVDKLVMDSQKIDKSLKVIEDIICVDVNDNIKEDLSNQKQLTSMEVGRKEYINSQTVLPKKKLVEASTLAERPNNCSDTNINILEKDIETTSNEESIASSQKEKNQITRIRQTLEKLLQISSEEKIKKGNQHSVLAIQTLDLEDREYESELKLSQNVCNKSVIDTQSRSQRVSQSVKIKNTDSEIFSLVKDIGEATFEFTESSTQGIICATRSKSQTGTMEYEENSVRIQNENNKTNSSVFLEQLPVVEIIDIDSDVEDETDDQMINGKGVNNKVSPEMIADTVVINENNADQRNLQQPSEIKSHDGLVESGNSTFVDEALLAVYGMNEIDVSQKNLLQGTSQESPTKHVSRVHEYDAAMVESSANKLGDRTPSGKIKDVVELTELLNIDKKEIDRQANQVHDKEELITIQDSNSDVSSYVISGNSTIKTKRRWKPKSQKLQNSETTNQLNINEPVESNEAENQNSLLDEKYQNGKIDQLKQNLSSQKQNHLENKDTKIADDHLAQVRKLTKKKTQNVDDGRLDLNDKQKRNRTTLYTTDQFEKHQVNYTEKVGNRAKKIPNSENGNLPMTRRRFKKLNKLASEENTDIPEYNLDTNSGDIISQSEDNDVASIKEKKLRKVKKNRNGLGITNVILNQNQLSNQEQNLRCTAHMKSNGFDAENKQLDISTFSGENVQENQRKVIVKKANNIETKIDDEIKDKNLKVNSQNDDEDDIFLKSTLKLYTPDQNEKTVSLSQEETEAMELKYQSQINKENDVESKLNDKTNNNQTGVNELDNKLIIANTLQEKFTKSFKMLQPVRHNDRELLQNLLTSQYPINNDHIVTTKDALQRNDGVGKIDENPERATMLTSLEEHNRAPIYDVHTETVISSSQKSKGSYFKRKLSQSDTKLLLKRRKRLYDPNDFSYLENDNTINHEKTISKLLSPMKSQQKQTEKKTGMTRKSRTSTNKNKAVQKTTYSVQHNERRSKNEQLVESAIEISYPKHVSTPIAKRRTRKPTNRNYKPETTKLEETDREIFDTFLLSFTKSANETTIRTDRKVRYSKRFNTARRTKTSKRKKKSSDEEFDFGRPSKCTNHQSKIKILENIVLQTADKRLETDFDTLRKSSTILNPKVNIFNSSGLSNQSIETKQILKILCIVLDLLVKPGQFNPDENETHRIFLQQCSDLQKTMKKLD